jgi:HYR domain-containing protein
VRKIRYLPVNLIQGDYIMKTPLFFACLVAIPVALASCGKEDNPSAPGTLSPQARAAATTNNCTNAFLGELSLVLAHWETGLEEERGTEFLPTPPSFSGDANTYLTALSPFLVGWKDSLEAWRGSAFLSNPPVFDEDVNAYLTALSPVLVSWKDSLETWRGHEFLQTPPLFVADTTPPKIACLADTTLCSGPEGKTVSFTVTASDSCDSEPTVECTPASGTVFPVGTTTVTCTATDADGNRSECTFHVTLGVDTLPPVIVCPSDTTVECTGNGHAPYTFVTTATDNCDPAPVVVCNPPSGSSFPLGTTTVTCTATDAAGNTAQCTFNVTVVDTEPPVIQEVSAHPAGMWPPNHKMADITVQVQAVDVCGSEVTNWIDHVTSNESVNGRGDGNTEPDWEITGPLQVRLRAERQGGGAGRVYTLVIKSSDSSGNTAEALVEVRVPHDSSAQ